MKNKNYYLLIALLIFLTTSCVTHRDYVFDVSGVVLTKDGNPLSGTKVDLQISKEVYKAITPINEANTLSDEKGEFSFSYIAPEPDMPYSITLRKDGFQEVVIKGTSRNSNPMRIEMIQK